MRHRQLPQDLQERVRRFVQYKWLATRGVDEESILRALPLDIRREIQRHLCLALVRRVSFLQFFFVDSDVWFGAKYKCCNVAFGIAWLEHDSCLWSYGSALLCSADSVSSFCLRASSGNIKERY